METTDRYFDLNAATWDEEPRHVQRAVALFHAIDEEVGLAPSMDVLDFGCGTGLLTLHLAARTGRVVALDRSEEMLDVLRAKAQACHANHVSARRVDLDAGDALDGAYDLVVSTMTLHHIEEPMALLRQFARVVKPGGSLCLADLDLEDGSFHGENRSVFHKGFDRAALRALMAKARFGEIRDRTAAEIVKTVGDGSERKFTVFLMTGRRLP